VAGVAVGDGGLLLVATRIVADAKEVTFEATMAPGHEVTEDAVELASGALTSTGVGERRRRTLLQLTSATRGRARGVQGCSCHWGRRGRPHGPQSR
jgi:hypothetical protein